MKKQMLPWGVTALALSPIVLLIAYWSSVPEPVVFYAEFDTVVEKLQTKRQLLTGSVVMAAAAVLIYLLLSRLHRIDPKVNADTPRSGLYKLGLTVSLFLTVVNLYLVLSAINGWAAGTGALIGFTGLMICLVGNFMNSIRPNYFAGIRLPWTLNDPDNWRKTHQLAAKLWFAAGLIVILCSFLLPGKLLIPLLIAVLLLIVLIPSLYSFRLYRNKR